MSISTAVIGRPLLLVLVAVVFAAGTQVHDFSVTAQGSADTTADNVAIIELANSFETSFDRGDIDANVDMWTDDLIFEHPSGTYSGKDAYRAWATSFYQQAASSGGSHHLMTNYEITVSGDSADMTAYLTLLVGITNPNPVIISGAFTDHLVKVDGTWKFQHRRLEIQTVFGPPSQGGTPEATATGG